MTEDRPDERPERSARDLPRDLLRRVTGEVTGRVVSAVDPDVILDEVDVDALLDRIDPNRLLDRVDPNALLDRVDPNALLDRVDVDRLLDQVDPNRLLDRVDVDRLLARVDVDRLLQGVDLEALVRRSGVPEIVAESTNAIGQRGLDLLRRQLVALDVLIDQFTDRLLRRDFSTEPAGPVELVDEGLVRQETGGRRSVSGHYAGPVTRLAALAVDAGLVVASFTLGLAGIGILARVFLGFSSEPDGFSPVALVALAIWAWIYSVTGHTVVGRTPGKGLVGIRVVRRDGGPLSARRAFWRTLFFPLSAVGGLGFLLALYHREHLALHDLLAGTTSVYDWGERAAELSGPLTAYLERRDL